MSVNTTENVKSYACDGSKKTFDFPFSIIGTDTSVLQVTLWEDSTGTPTPLTEGSGNKSYSVSAPNNNYENGGTVSTTELDGVSYVAYAWPEGYTITIERIVPYTQPSQFTSGGLDPVALENTFDHQEYQMQQLDKRKSIHGPASDPITSIYEIPGVTARKGRVLGFDSTNGDVEAVSVLPTSGVSVTAFAETLLDDTTAAVARGTLGLDKDDTVEFQTLRTVESPINVLHSDYGADPSGINDSTAALQAAIDAATAYGTVVLPPGTYKFSQLKFYNPIIFTGLGGVAGRWNSTVAGVKLLHDESTNPAIIIGGTSDSVIKEGDYYVAEGITLANFLLYPTGITANVGILVDGSTTIYANRACARGIRFENVVVRDFGSNNIKFLGGAFDIRFKGGGSFARYATGILGETANYFTGGTSTPGQLHFYDFYSTALTGYWNFYGANIFLYGGGVAYGNGFYAKSRCQVYGTHFEGKTSDPASIGLQIVGQYGIFCPGVISAHDTAIKIGDGTATIARHYFINTTINSATLGVHITDGGHRYGSGIIYFAGDVTTDIQDDRADNDSVYNELHLLYDRRVIRNIATLDNTGTPSVGDSMAGGGIFLTGGTTEITALDDAYPGQIIIIIGAHSTTQLTDGGTLKLAGNCVLDTGDTIQLVFDGTNWHEISRTDVA